MTTRKEKITDIYSNQNEALTLIQFSLIAFAVIKYANSRFYKEIGSSFIQFMVLQILESRGTMTLSEIAIYTLKVRHNITTLIYRMQRDGHVSTKPNTSDRRSTHVNITDDGRKALKKMEPVFHDIIDLTMKSLTDNDAIELQKYLFALMENVRKHSE
ncbi:MarR family winged helix-turn-helix transcriptional regulator [Chloroflexota bacterium]